MILTKNQPLWRRALIVSAIAIAGVSLTGCSMINGLLPGGGSNGTDGNGDSSSGPEESGESASVFDITVGDCIGESTDEETVTDVKVIDCASPHSYEVFHEFEIASATFPCDDAVADEAYDGCIAKFEPFVGVAYEDSALDFTYFSPLEDGWKELGDKLVSCLIVDPNGPSTGSLAGAAR